MIGRRSSLGRAIRVLATAALAGSLASAVLANGTSAITLKSAYVSLRGEGSWGVEQQLVPWQNELATADSFIDLNYNPRGSFFGRDDLAQGVSDFAISGRPFTGTELAKVKGGASAFISAPISVSTLATLIEPPYGGFQSLTIRCDPDDPSTWPPDVTDGSIGCVVHGVLTDPIKIPNRNLAAMYLNYGGGGQPALNDWNNAGIVGAMHISQFSLLDQLARPDVAGRSDPDEISYYLQQFEATAAPDVWHDNQQFYPGAVWEPITERTPVVVGVSRDGAEQQVDQLAQNGFGVGLATSSFVQGGIAAAPPSTQRSFHSTFPGQGLSLALMQNANGDWVGPTPASIDKAVDAGGTTPLYALTHKVAGAYPLVWVDNFYAPAHGLSIEKTEGLATLIRYLATTGQKGAATVGEGRLPASLVTKALQAADDLVRSNCEGSDREVVVNTDPGSLAPSTATEMKSIGQMAHCVPASGATTTTSTTSSSTTSPSTAAPTSAGSGSSADTTGFDSSSSFSGGAAQPNASGGSSGGRGSGGGGGAGGAKSTPPTRAGTQKTLNGVLTASKLPLSAPGGPPGTDRLATFLLGAVLYLFLRKPVARLARRMSA